MLTPDEMGKVIGQILGSADALDDYGAIVKAEEPKARGDRLRGAAKFLEEHATLLFGEDE